MGGKNGRCENPNLFSFFVATTDSGHTNHGIRPLLLLQAQTLGSMTLATLVNTSTSILSAGMGPLLISFFSTSSFALSFLLTLFSFLSQC